MSKQYQLNWRLVRCKKSIYLKLKFRENDAFWQSLNLLPSDVCEGSTALRALAELAANKSFFIWLELKSNAPCYLKADPQLLGSSCIRSESVLSMNAIKRSRHAKWSKLINGLKNYLSPDQLSYLGFSDKSKVKEKQPRRPRKIDRSHHGPHCSNNINPSRARSAAP